MCGYALWMVDFCTEAESQCLLSSFWLRTSPKNFLFDLIFHTCVNSRILRKQKENYFKNSQALSFSAFNKLFRVVYYSLSASNLCTVYSFFLFNKEISKQYSGYDQRPKYSPWSKNLTVNKSLYNINHTAFMSSALQKGM